MKSFVQSTLCVGVLLGAQFPGRIQACSLCENLVRTDTLGMEFERAEIVVFGRIANSRLNIQPGAAPGTGSTDFHVEKVLKDTSRGGPWKDIVIPRYLPVLDAKNAPYMLFFCNIVKGKLDPYHGRTATPALLEYLQATTAVRAKDRVSALVQYAKFLNHGDRAVAADAFLEFAISKDADVGQASKRLDPQLVRFLVRDAKEDPDRLSLLAFLLGGCGNEQDASFLRGLLEPPDPKMARALDGVLAGYVQLKPKEGWALTYQLLADRKSNFAVRYAAVRTLRFCRGWQPKETRDPVLHGLSLLIPDGEMADLAVEDLRQWQEWGHTALIVAQYGKSTHAAPIIRRSIVRYALCCPRPEARDFIDRVRRIDPETVSDLEEYLQFERKK